MWSSPGAAGRRPPPCSGEPITPPRAAPPPACAGCAPHAPATLGMREAASACPRRGWCRVLWCARGWLVPGAVVRPGGWLVPVFGLVRPRGGVGHRVGASRAGRPLGPGAGHRARERCDSGLGGVLTDVAGRGLFRARMLPGCGRRAGHASPRACTATGPRRHRLRGHVPRGKGRHPAQGCHEHRAATWHGVLPGRGRPPGMRAQVATERGATIKHAVAAGGRKTEAPGGRGDRGAAQAWACRRRGVGPGEGGPRHGDGTVLSVRGRSRSRCRHAASRAGAPTRSGGSSPTSTASPGTG